MEIKKFEKPLCLTSKNELVLHFLGTGSAFTKQNFQNNLLIIKNDVHIMVDFGTKASQALYEKGSNVTNIKTYLITHQHADHIGGMEEAALMGRYFTKKAPDLILTPVQLESVWENSLKGGLGSNEKCPNVLDDFFNVILAEEDTTQSRSAYKLNYKGIDLILYKTNHIPDCALSWKDAVWTTGLIIDKKILFSCDTRFDQELLLDFDKRYNLEVIFHDCQFYQGGVHASYDELKTLPDTLKKKMLLTHYADNWKQYTPEADGFQGFTSPDVYYHFSL